MGFQSQKNQRGVRARAICGFFKARSVFGAAGRLLAQVCLPYGLSNARRAGAYLQSRSSLMNFWARPELANKKT
jgi:hypothetical protein